MKMTQRLDQEGPVMKVCEGESFQLKLDGMQTSYAKG